jgi:hypothetical protein
MWLTQVFGAEILQDNHGMIAGQLGKRAAPAEMRAGTLPECGRACVVVRAV